MHIANRTLAMKAFGCICGIFSVTFALSLNIVSTCPTDKASWIKRSQHFNCTTPFSYHCGFMDHGTLGELCLNHRKLPSKYCPMFKMNPQKLFQLWNCTHNAPIKAEQCNEENLPQNGVVSDELFRYPVCFLGQELKTISSKDSSQKPESDTVSNDKLSLDRIGGNTSFGSTIPELRTYTIAIVSAIVAFLIIVLTINIVVFVYHRKRHSFTSVEVQNAEMISDMEIVNEEDIWDANMFEYGDDLAIHSAVITQNDNTVVEDVEFDTPYDHLHSNRVIKIDGVNHVRSAP